MAGTPDLYEVLGVARSASITEIKSAYRALARQYHPDYNPGDSAAEERFKEISHAYAILSDDDKRAAYDRTGSIDGPSDPFYGAGVPDFGDLFDFFFGGQAQSGRQRAPGRNGEDLRVDIEIDLDEVLTGADREIAYRRLAKCETCTGTGAEGGATPEKCTTCNGQGVVSRVQQTFIGNVRTTVTCGACNGEGTVIKKKCPDCAGRGLSPIDARIKIRVPPGVDDGVTIHLPGRGGDGTGAGRAGDLYVVVSIAAHPRFLREGADLLTILPLGYAQLALGDEIVVAGLAKEQHPVRIPSGTQPGTQFRIRAAGVPRPRSGPRGELVVQVQVRIPEKVTTEQTEAIQALAAALGEPAPTGEASSLLGGLFKKLKK